MEHIEEGVGESSSPPRGVSGKEPPHDINNDIYARLVESGHPEALSNPYLRDQIDAHFSRLPTSYAVDINVDRADDVLLHRKLLADAKDPEKRPAFGVRFMKHIRTRAELGDQQQFLGVVSTSGGYDDNEREGETSSNIRDGEFNFEACSKLEDLNLDVGRNIRDNADGRSPIDAHSARDDGPYIPIHEIIFSAVDKPKLLSQLSAVLSDIGLNIREAHVFSTTDGYSLDVFVVDGWHDEETDTLQEKIKEAMLNSEGSFSGSATPAAQPMPFDSEVDRRLLKMREKIGCGSCGDLYCGSYLGQDVAIKVLHSDHLNETMRVEFAQELMILREVQHKNVVRFVGACTNPPQFCIVTEFMHGGSLYDYLHKQKNIPDLTLLLKFALDVCEGMDYLHQKNIIHRDLKTANLLMDNNQVVKVADFGVARFQSQGGVMTAETGTYRWMAPEVINHQPYDRKVDVFSFAIVLWELATSKIPYDSMTPLQAALGVRQGLRPDLPENLHPKLLDLMQRCWETWPAKRPSFTRIISELKELLLQQMQLSGETSKKEKDVS